MSKKKNLTPFGGDMKDFMQFSNLLNDMMERNNLSQDNLVDMLNAMDEAGGNGELMTKMYYGYEKPDYGKMARPLHPALEPLMKIIMPKGIVAECDKAKAQLESEGADAAGELRNAVYWILANQDSFYGQEKSCLPLYCVLHLMLEMNACGMADALLELLRQDGHFFEFFFDAFEEDLSLVICRLCADDLDRLEQFMYEVGLIPTSKCIVADAVIHSAVIEPARRFRVIGFFAKVLNRYCDIRVIETNIDHIVRSLGQLKPVELKPVIEKLYKVKDIPFIEVESMKEVKSLIEKGTTERRVEVESLASLFEAMEKNYDEDKKNRSRSLFGDYIDEDDENIDNLLTVDRAFDEKLYLLEVTLDGAPVPISRELIVPSNIRLSHLDQVLMIAMGWEGYHLSQFHKGRHTYHRESELEDDWFGGPSESMEDYALNMLIKRKGGSIQWEYDFGDSWMHTIKLVEQIKDDCERPLLELVSATGACPPEDCGGVWGYEELLEILSDKNHPEYEERMEWLGGVKFDPNKAPEKKKVNKELYKYYQDNY